MPLPMGGAMAGPTGATLAVRAEQAAVESKRLRSAEREPLS